MTLPGLHGTRVAVTAGAGGIGYEIAAALAGQGARVAICDVEAERLAEAKAALGAEVSVLADVSNEAQVAAFFAEISKAMGGLDALVNNAGIAGPTGGVEEIAPEDWRRCIDVGLTGQFLCTHHAVPMLKDAGGGALRLRLPHTLCGGEMGGDRVYPKPRQGIGPVQYPRQRDPARHHRRPAHGGGDRRPRGTSRGQP